MSEKRECVRERGVFDMGGKAAAPSGFSFCSIEMKNRKMGATLFIHSPVCGLGDEAAGTGNWVWLWRLRVGVSKSPLLTSNRLFAVFRCFAVPNIRQSSFFLFNDYLSSPFRLVFYFHTLSSSGQTLMKYVMNKQ